MLAFAVVVCLVQAAIRMRPGSGADCQTMRLAHELHQQLEVSCSSGKHMTLHPLNPCAFYLGLASNSSPSMGSSWSAVVAHGTIILGLDVQE